MATDENGNVYVADAGNHRIQKFDASGTFLIAWGSRGCCYGYFEDPTGVATDGRGHVFVADYNDTHPDANDNRIQMFDANGTFLTAWGSTGRGDGQFAAPLGVAADGSGNVYVLDVAHGIQKFACP